MSKNDEKEKKEEDLSGKYGLKNLGNTCYLNSALQCLSHIKEVIAYTTSDEFDNDLQQNYNLHSQYNTLKDKNEETQLDKLHSLAKNFQKLIQMMWTKNNPNNSNQIIPKDFKNSLQSIYPEFGKNIQQDSHEVLTNILDSLHLALNKKINLNGYEIRKEIQTDNLLRKTQSYVADKSYKECNDSFINDQFFGQMNSCIKCYNCGKIITENYEPFSCLELPIPNSYRVFLYFIPIKKNHKPSQMFVNINDNMKYENIIEIVKTISNYNLISGTFYMVYKNKLEKILDNDERCENLMNRRSFLFLIEDNPNFSNSKLRKSNFYIELNFNIINIPNNNSVDEDDDEEENEKNENFTYPRIFSYYINSEAKEENMIYLKIFNEINDYVKQYLNTNENIQIDQNYNFLIKSQKNKIKDNYYCFICEKENIKSFNCDCINSFLKKNSTINLELNNKLRKCIEEDQQFILSVILNISLNIIKIKDLNRCTDHTYHLIQEKDLTLNDLCHFYFSEEKVQNNSHCNICGDIKYTLQKQELHKFPKILIIHFKRFRSENEKNDSLIDFNEEIDLTQYNNKGLNGKYILNGVINHTGNLKSGHYIAICKHHLCNRWIQFNDTDVKELPEGVSYNNLVNNNIPSIPKGEAYILFYRKKDEGKDKK